MGLDMYLTAKLFLSEYDEEQKDLKERIERMFFKLGLKVEKVEFEIHTWRKANAIHHWFVERVQNGNDDCRQYYVSFNMLEELSKIINEILEAEGEERIKIAQRELPTQSGFFFGTTDYDYFYFEDLRETKETLDRIMNNKEKYAYLEYYYESSW